MTEPTLPQENFKVKTYTVKWIKFNKCDLDVLYTNQPRCARVLAQTLKNLMINLHDGVFSPSPSGK